MINDLPIEEKKELENLVRANDYIGIEEFINTLNKEVKEKPFFLNLLGVCKISKKVSNFEIAKEEAKKSRALFKKAYEKDKNFIDALYNLAEISLKTVEFDDVLIFLQKHLEKVGYDFKTVFFLARIYFHLGETEKTINYYDKIIEKKDATKFIFVNQPYIYNYSSKYSQKKYSDYCKKYVNSIKIIDESKLLKLEKEKEQKKIKIGFFSTNFRDHAVMKFFMPTIRFLNKNFETFAFNFTNPRFQDDVTKELKQNFSSWHDIHDLDDIAAVNLIRKNKINILFDLVGYSGGGRLELFKYRSAPIQISWIGYTNSTGITEMDYIIADPNVLNSDEHYTEKILRLPNIWSCHSPLKEQIKVNELPFKKNGFITFGSFNSFAKISDDTIILWSQILKKIGAKLLLKSSSSVHESAKRTLLKKFENYGVDLKKIEFLKRSETYEKHLQCYNKIDIALDTIPYNGATTSFESIWMGVPVLTTIGNSFTSRYGYSINKNLNLNDFIAKNNEDLLNKALNITSKIDELSKLRNNLRSIALKSPLFDTIKFNNDFLNLIRQIT